MDKRALETAAQQLATAELVCRGMGIILRGAQKELAQLKPKSIFEGIEVKQQRQQLEQSVQTAQKDFDDSLAEVTELTEQVNAMRAQLPELSGRRYWWDVPFRPEETVELDAYCFDSGDYVETPPLHTGMEGNRSVLRPREQAMNYTMLSTRLTDPRFIPIHLDKKKLKLHLNDSMELRGALQHLLQLGAVRGHLLHEPGGGPLGDHLARVSSGRAVQTRRV